MPSQDTMERNSVQHAGEVSGQFRGPHLFSTLFKEALSQDGDLSDTQKSKLATAFNFLGAIARYAEPDYDARVNFEVPEDVVVLIDKSALPPSFKTGDTLMASQVSWDSPKSEYSGSKQCAGWLTRFGKDLSGYCEEQGIETSDTFDSFANGMG